MTHVVVIPASFETRKAEPISLALELARSTKPLKIFLVCDRKGASLKAAEDALQHLGNDHQIELIVVSAKDTGMRWGFGIDAVVSFLCKAGTDADLLLCMPGDPDPEFFETSRPVFERKLRHFLKEAASHDLTVGDYSIPLDPTKENWDLFHTLQYIIALHPSNAVELARKSISKLRSEFFVIRFDRIGSWIEPSNFPSDPTPFMIETILRHRGSIGVTHLGEFTDEDLGRTGVVAKAYQTVRLALEMAINHAADERQESRRLDEPLDQQLARSRQLRERLSNLCQALQNGIRMIESSYATPFEPSNEEELE